MKYTRVYHENLNAYLAGYRLLINQGGQASGKTYSILQLLAQIALLSKKRKHIVITSYALPHLKGGAMKFFEEILEKMNVNVAAIKNKSEHTYYLNKTRIEFFGIEGNEARAHSLRPDILFVNECNRRISWEVFRQFYSRVQETTIVDFNPSAEFWLNDHILNKEQKYIVIRSNYLDNPFIAANEFEFIDGKKNNPEWSNWYKVYGLGEFGQLEDAILNYQYGEFDPTLPVVYGLDFGIRDPDALVKVAVDKDKNRIYVEELLYEIGQSTSALAARLAAIIPGRSLVIADSAAARTIEDLRRAGLNVQPAQKFGKVESLKRLRAFDIIITEQSYHLQRELMTYTWLDRAGEVPKDGDDHLIDAMHYAARYLLDGPQVTITKNPLRANKL
jgi:phage terminase large subunit